METKIEVLEDNRVKVITTIEAAVIDARIKKTYKEFATKSNFPGFRKGKAPRKVIDNAYGPDAVRATVTEDLVNEMAPIAADSMNLTPVAAADFGAEGPALVVEGQDYVLEFIVPVAPQMELTSYEPVEITMPNDGANEAEVADQITALQEHYFTYKDAPANTKIKKESVVELKIAATNEAGEEKPEYSSESRLYTIGSGLMPEGFDAEIMGLKKGESKEFALEAGEKINFAVDVIVLKKKVLPELTDEWVKESLGFESVEDLKTRIVDSISEQKADILPRLKESNCLVALQDRLEGEAPANMVEDAETTLLQDFFTQLQRQGVNFDTYLMQQGLTADQFKEDLKQQAADVAKQDLALDAYARHFELTATDEEVAEEFVKAGVPNPKALEEEWRKAGRLHEVRNGITRTKAIADVMEKAIVTIDEYTGEEK